MDDRRDIFVVCDPGRFASEHILQIASKARGLAEECGGSVAAICIGCDSPEGYEALGRCGADKIIAIGLSEARHPWAVADVVAAAIKSKGPRAVLFPATETGKAVAATLSARFGAGLTADCIDIKATGGAGFVFTRAAINDSVVAQISCINCATQMCTIKKDVFVKEERRDRPAARVERFECSPPAREGRVFEVLSSIKRIAKKSVDIGKYPIVFCVGRGVKDERTRDRIAELAKKCGAGLVGTRAAVEERLVEKERQVGQSGKSISPRVYVGFGVSGASQHMVGIKNAGVIIAINNDERAAIFNYADYPILDDITNVVDEMERALYECGAAA